MSMTALLVSRRHGYHRAAKVMAGESRTALFLLLSCLVAGCFTPTASVCRDGRICPAGTLCDDARSRCVAPAQQTVCVGVKEHDTCTAAGTPGTCIGGACTPYFCGDGRRTGTESCDGADLDFESCEGLGYYGQTTGLACKSDCTFETKGCTGICGDLQIDEGELCDGSPAEGSTCQDFGYDRGLMSCSASCGASSKGCDNLGWQAVTGLEARRFTAIWGSGPDDIYAVGRFGLAAHWNGQRWSEISLGTNADFAAIWGSGPDDVYVLDQTVTDQTGFSSLHHWDGQTWSPVRVEIPSAGCSNEFLFFTDIWGAGPDDVFLSGVGDCSIFVLHWNGTSWSRMPLPQNTVVQRLWGSGPNDVFAGTDAWMLHWDGVSWSPLPPVSSQVLSIWGSGPDDVYAIAGDTLLMHYDGKAWSAVLPLFQFQPRAIWGSGPADVYVAGTDSKLNGQVALAHWNGTTWSKVESPPGLGYTVVESRSLWSAPGGALYLAGSGIVSFAGANKVASTRRSSAELLSYGLDEILQLGLPPFSPAPQTGDGEVYWSSVVSSQRYWGASRDDVWAVGGSQLDRFSHWSGLKWSTVKPDWRGSGTPAYFLLTGIWGNGLSDIFAIGGPVATAEGSGFVTHWDGLAWSEPVAVTAPGTTGLKGVWSSGPTDAFAVGDHGTIVHWDGKTWSSMTSGTLEDLSSIWGSGPANVFAVGAAGTILRFDGARWTAMRSLTRAALHEVRGSGAGDVFVAGDGVLLHLRGTGWESITVPPNFRPLSLFVSPSVVHVGGEHVGGDAEMGVLERPTVTCVGPERACDDGWDNDCDGRQDGADADCAGRAPAEQCANLSDDNGDGKVDCADKDCMDFPSCRLGK